MSATVSRPNVLGTLTLPLAGERQMRQFGELCLLMAFIGSGVAAFTGFASQARWLRRIGVAGTLISLTSLTLIIGILARALAYKDFSYEYVAQHSSQHLAWYYSMSALWVGQAGSILLWAWLLALLAITFRFWPRSEPGGPRSQAFGVMMAYLCFLIAILVFAADPMAASITAPNEGVGMSPLLQHTAMLIHPPIVFLGYALWTVPFALAIAGLATGKLDQHWVRLARPWALAAWTVLGAGILLGANWAYEELGWGGFWGWDPVENGSLVPWLTGTALLHALMSWQHRGVLKKTAVTLAIATFGLCNFATFLTRSGIFSSLHAFSQSPIGWLFLALMAIVAAGGLALVVYRRELLTTKPMGSIFSREAMIAISAVALLLLTAAVIGGTLTSTISSALGKTVAVGPGFYNSVMVPTGLVLLGATAVAPLLRWGKPPTSAQQRWLIAAGVLGVAAATIAFTVGIREPIFLVVVAMTATTLAGLCGSLVIDASRYKTGGAIARLATALLKYRTQYAGFVIHAGFVCLAIGIAGSSLGSTERTFQLLPGESVSWEGRQVQLVRTYREAMPDKLIDGVELGVTSGERKVSLFPSRHFHLLNRSWTTEVAIDATFAADFYVIAHGTDQEGRTHLTAIVNPLMRWLWIGGWIVAAGSLIRLWPGSRRKVSMAVARDKESNDSQVVLTNGHRKAA